MKQAQLGRSYTGTIIGIVLAVCAGLLYLNQVLVRDSVRAWLYEPSPGVVSLEQRLDLTTEGKRYFFASQPSLSAAENFNQRCEDIEKTSIVLGCYTGTHIYIYDVNNRELDGIKEVTAAHEMLHAAYDRLAGNEQKEVNQLLSNQSARLQRDTTFQERMSVYDKLSADERLIELHSILGTEVSTLNPELEQYYDRYFDDRAYIVKLFDKYSSVFRELQQNAENLAAKLDQTAASINSRVEAFNSASKNLNAEVESFNRRAQSGAFSSQAQFDSERSQLVARSSYIETEQMSIKSAIVDYEKDRAKLSGIAEHITTLSRSIDSKLAQPEKVR